MSPTGSRLTEEYLAAALTKTGPLSKDNSTQVANAATQQTASLRYRLRASPNNICLNAPLAFAWIPGTRVSCGA